MISEPQEMPLPDVGPQARALYEKIKSHVETPDNIGKFITFDILSGDYEISSDYMNATEGVRARHEKVQTCTLRIGYRTTFSYGGRMQRTA